MRAGLPIVTIVGRPNVGKSTLFNRLARGRKSIVTDAPNATQDWLESECSQGGAAFRLVDTAGAPAPDTEHAEALRESAGEVLSFTDLALLVVDVRAGPHPIDREILGRLRRSLGPGRILLAVNKAEGRTVTDAAGEFHELGLPEMSAVSAERGDNVRGLAAKIAERLGAGGDAPEDAADPRTSMVFVGHTNVGKSSLVNALLGRSRMIVSSVAGTTRDCVEVRFGHGGRDYTLIDTAGLRRRGKVHETVERASTSRTWTRSSVPTCRFACWTHRFRRAPRTGGSSVWLPSPGRRWCSCSTSGTWWTRGTGARRGGRSPRRWGCAKAPRRPRFRRSRARSGRPTCLERSTSRTGTPPGRSRPRS